MGYATIPEAETALIIRALGLVVSQAGVYGPQHNVTQSAARSVFMEIDRTLKKYGAVEVTLGDKQLLVNGVGMGAGAIAGKNLFDRMTLHKLGGFLLSPPLDLHEFVFFVGLFGTPPQSLAGQGGFETILRKTAFRSVQGVTVSYQRVTGETPEPVHESAHARPLAAVAARTAEPAKAALSQTGVLDLSADLAGEAPPADAEDTADAVAAPPQETGSAAARRQRAQALAAMLRDAAAVLEEGGADDPREMNGALSRVREVLDEMTSGSRRGISTLASELEEDSKTIASIESAARRRGIGLKLTRVELMQRYAELNQEIVQPLTVSTGVIDLLKSGKTGGMTESQLDLLRMAAESMDRVNQLVNYLNRVSGLPESLTPDAAVIQDSYRV